VFTSYSISLKWLSNAKINLYKQVFKRLRFEENTETQNTYFSKAESNSSQTASFYGLCAGNGEEARQE